MLAGLRSHARRMVATALAVIAGVGFVAGTLVFTDTARAGFDTAFARTARNVDVVVRPTPPTESTPAGPRLVEEALAAVRALSDVDVAEARLVRPLALLDRRGRPVVNFGRVGVAVSTDGDERLLSFDVRGRRPAATGEALLDAATAGRQRLAIGEQVTVVDPQGGRHAYTLVGLLEFGASTQFSDVSVVGLPAGQIAALTGSTGYDEIVSIGRRGVSQERLADAVRAAVGPGAQVITGDRLRSELADNAVSVSTQFAIVLLLFGAISLVVAAFVIYNTFAILLAQRVRETALLRCVGATRAQIFRMVVAESAVIGVVGGAAGVGLGIGIGFGLFGLLNGVLHAGIPAHAVVVGATPVLSGLSLGLVVTVVSALVPAIRATRTAPLGALRDLPTVRPARRGARVVRGALAGLVGAAGLALTAAGRGMDDPQAGSSAIVAGGVVTFLGVLIGSPLFIGPLVAVLGAVPARLFGTTVRLAVANTRRNPGRTAVTTASLMIGIGLMSVFSVVVASVRATAAAQLVAQYPVDYVLSGVAYDDGGRAGVPTDLAGALRREPRFAAVVEVRVVEVTLDGAPARVAAIDPGSLGSLVNPSMTVGSLRDLRPGTAIVADRGSGPAAPGPTIALAHGGASLALPVVGASRLDSPGIRSVDALVTWSDLIALAGPGDDSTVMVKAAPGVTPEASWDALSALSDAHPLVQVDSVAGLSSELDEAVTGLIALFTGLVGTAVLIALFGIANTLSLSVVERTRESATARALGLTRGQLRATLLVEAALMGLVGALVGIVFGIVFGPLVVAEAFATIDAQVVVPWLWLAALAGVAAAAGLVAAVLPARRAARGSIVAAMADT